MLSKSILEKRKGIIATYLTCSVYLSKEYFPHYTAEERQDRGRHKEKIDRKSGWKRSRKGKKGD